MSTPARGLALAVVMCSLFSPAVSPAAEKLPAFSGAEGFGATSRGGRGGEVLPVTNLKDYRPGQKPIVGSLRAACEAKGPRTIVFRIAGTIELAATLKISEPQVTIDGQSAPAGGICLKNYGVSINTQDVVLRYLRIRPGDELGPVYKKRGKSFEPDGLSIGAPSRRVIVDHCSVSWAIDECLSVSGAGISDVTVQWCLISESLNDSFHAKGPHGYGSLLRTNGRLSFHHNIYAHHRSRSPRPGTYGEGSILLDFRNNVIYDSTGYSAADPVRMNYVGNYIKRPRGHVFRIGGAATRMYVADNFLEGGGERNRDPWKLISGAAAGNKADKPFDVSKVTTYSAADVYRRTLKSCGAILPKRDAVDARVIEQIRTGKGHLIDSQKQVGGWPVLRSSDTSPTR